MQWIIHASRYDSGAGTEFALCRVRPAEPNIAEGFTFDFSLPKPPGIIEIAARMFREGIAAIDPEPTFERAALNHKVRPLGLPMLDDVEAELLTAMLELT